MYMGFLVIISLVEDTLGWEPMALGSSLIYANTSHFPTSYHHV